MKRPLLLLAFAVPALASAGSIDPQLVDRRVREISEEVQRCYDEGLSRNPRLKGKVSVLFTVEKDGSVSDAVAKKSTLSDEAVTNCVLDAFRTLSFPDLAPGCDASKEDCTVKITYPLTFSP